eukprot:364263-Chlamydomonas_euryale.AAC.17
MVTGVVTAAVAAVVNQASPNQASVEALSGERLPAPLPLQLCPLDYPIPPGPPPFHCSCALSTTLSLQPPPFHCCALLTTLSLPQQAQEHTCLPADFLPSPSSNRVRVLNDFEAVGYGIPALEQGDIVPVNMALEKPMAPKVRAASEASSAPPGSPGRRGHAVGSEALTGPRVVLPGGYGGRREGREAGHSGCPLEEVNDLGRERMFWGGSECSGKGSEWPGRELLSWKRPEGTAVWGSVPRGNGCERRARGDEQVGGGGKRPKGRRAWEKGLWT